MSAIDVLKPHNQEAFQEINKMIESGTKRIAVPRATGSGKTYLMGALAEKYNNDKKLVLEPTRPLLDSIKEKFDEFGIGNTDFMTYQKLIRMSDEDIAAMDYKLIFLDECHHGTAPIWGQKTNYLMETHSDSIIFGTSATTVRNDGVNVVETLFEGNAVGELPLSTAIARKVLPCPHYITAIYRLDDEFEKLKKRIEASTNDKAEKKEFYEKMKIMQSHFEKSYGIPTILNKYIKVKNGRYLVFCKNKKHLDTMRDVVVDWFKTAGIKNVHSYAVYSDYPDKEKDYKEFCEDNSDSCKILFSINMLNEGLHIPDISGVLMLRTTQSNLIYLQQLGRLLEAGNLGKYLLVFDFVNNFSSVNDGIGLLREIKEVVAREKESDPNYDDSEFEGIDTFFVLEQVIQVQEMFAEIEERLEGSWDLYIKALKQYKDREGNCDVPSSHIEIVGRIEVKLGQWVINVRCTKNGEGKALLTTDQMRQLDELDFIWDGLKYRFENKIKAVAEYYKENGKYPSVNEKDFRIKELVNFLRKQKTGMRKANYPIWKENIIKQYLPDFSYEYETEKSFNEFIYYARLYKERYGHTEIKGDDVIDGFKIGMFYTSIKQRKNTLSKEKIKKLEKLDINLECEYNKMLFQKKLNLAKKAIENNVVISRENKMYEHINLYDWIKSTIRIKYRNGELLNNEIAIIESLLNKPLYKFFNRGRDYIHVVDVIDNIEIAVCSSRKKAAEKLSQRINIFVSESVVHSRVSGKVTTPYKGRFMFYRATDEEIKKYFEDNKAS